MTRTEAQNALSIPHLKICNNNEFDRQKQERLENITQIMDETTTM
jgi:hypothetical protein